jgi:hypothetical protein
MKKNNNLRSQNLIIKQNNKQRLIKKQRTKNKKLKNQSNKVITNKIFSLSNQ